MGYRTDLLTGIATLLHQRGIGVWRSNGAYTASETAIVLATVPSSPDRVITLTGYGVSDNPASTDDIEGVQVHCRWGGQDPRPVDDLADAIFDELHNAGPLTLSTGIRVEQIHRQSSAPMGQDTNARWARSDNYYVTAHRPSLHRL